MPDPASPAIVCVLGASRSGTSLTARILGLTGLYLGPEDGFFPASNSNPAGFWEQAGITGLNETILARLGGSWSEPPSMPPGWEGSDQLELEREQAAVLLERIFAGRGRWGWKDPRNCLTLPFWQRLLPPMRYVVCLRNPVDVAASLAHRDGISAEQSHALWLAYVASALVHTSGQPRLLVSYEEYFDDWRATAARLARFAGASPLAAGSAAEDAIGAEIDTRLWHHRTAPADLLEDSELPDEAVYLHIAVELLRSAADGPDGDGAGEGRAEREVAVDLLAARLLAHRLPPSEE